MWSGCAICCHQVTCLYFPSHVPLLLNSLPLVSPFCDFFSLAYSVLVQYILQHLSEKRYIECQCFEAMHVYTHASFYSQNLRDSWAGYRILARNCTLSKEYPYLPASAVTVQKSNAILILDISRRPHFILEAFKIFFLGFWAFVTMCFLVRVGFSFSFFFF